jgi:murein DD-endopeptidase MepM/ murein hydrolase activator NlpD
MDEPSFDPHSWAKTPSQKGMGQQGADQKSEGEKAGAEKAGEEQAPPLSPPPVAPAPTTSLPDAWRAVVDDVRAGKAGITSPPQRQGRSWLTAAALTALAALLIAGGTWAWLNRAPAPPPGAATPAAIEQTPAAASPASPPEPVAPSAVERSLNLATPAKLVTALIAMGVSPAEADQTAQAAAPVLSAPNEIRARIVLLPVGEGMSLQKLHASYADGSGAVVTRDEAGRFKASAVAADLTHQIKVLNGELDSESFYTSAVAAGLVDTLIPEFINAFGYDFNLASEVLPGDTFEVAYEQSVNENGDSFGQPQLVFAQLTTRTKSLALYRFKNPDGTVGWYDGNGGSTQRGFMRTPINGARITSKFGMRFHPVLHYTRLHGGVDFGAPIGTPIYAAAEGTVISASPSRCAGNMVIIQHANGYETRYFHLSRYADGLHAGQTVAQGFTIGLVGTTGTCTTGPHLHYEVHIKGEKVDPLSVKTDDAQRKKMDPNALAAFMRERNRVDVARARQAF